MSAVGRLHPPSSTHYTASLTYPTNILTLTLTLALTFDLALDLGMVHTKTKLKEIVLNENDNSVNHLVLGDGTEVKADYYISAMPVDVMKRYVPTKWQNMPYFRYLISDVQIAMVD